MNIETIIYRVVCRHYNISNPEFIFKKCREHQIVFPRQLFFDLCTKFTKLSLQKIGSLPVAFGVNAIYDHATVLHSKKVVKNKLDTDIKFMELYAYMYKVIVKNIEQNEEKRESIIEQSLDINRFFQMKNEYEQKIIELRIEHKKEIERRESMRHPIFNELKNASDKHLDFFYLNRWKPYKKLNKIK